MLPRACHTRICFNSIKVQLELQEPLSPFRVRMFQFHKGAIGTIPLRHVVLVIRMFQFHKGAIGTLAGCELIATLTRFNSIKVQLEQEKSRKNTTL